MSNPYDAVVLDSNVFAKLFLNEPGRDTAAALVNYLNQRGMVWTFRLPKQYAAK